MYKILLIFIVYIILVVVGTQIDDELSDEVHTLLNKVKQKNENEAYTYLLGIYASKNDDPITVGLNLLEEYRMREEDDSYSVKGYPEEKKLPLPEGELFCHVREDDCLANLFSMPFDIISLREEYEILIARMKKFHKYDEYHTLTKPLVFDQYPDYKYISNVERLAVLSAIDKHKKGEDNEAIMALMGQFNNLRKMLKLQDELTGKSVYLMNMSDLLDVASVILSKNKKHIEVDVISALTLSEKYSDLVVAREFYLTYSGFMRLDRHPEIFKVGGDFPGWITRVLYKPNMSINAIAPIFDRLDRLSKMRPDEFAYEVESGGDVVTYTFKFRNFVGSRLIEDYPSLDEYVARFMDFDAKLVLFNQIHHFRNSVVGVENPYYEGKFSYVSEGAVCFDGPLENKRKLRCLHIEI